MNGRRLVNFPTRNGAVDLNTLPTAAIGRIEVLKDGAAATYGSDAIGGVVNFITRKNFNGLEVSADVKYVPDAYDPDYGASAVWGWSGDNGNVLLSAGWQRKGRLRPVDRDFSTPTYLENPDAGYSFTNNPTTFRPIVGATTAANFAAQIRDPGCATVGAQPGFVGGAQVCLARYAGTTVNLQDPSDRFQLYGETNFDLSDTVKFHAEGLYSETYTEGWTSPFPSGLQGPTALTSPLPGQYYAPVTNPGLALLIQQFPNAFPAGTTGVVWPTSLNFRPFGLGGFPITGGEANPVVTDIKTYRVSGGFSGKLFDDAIGWDIASTYNVTNFKQSAYEYYVNRQELALRGYGSLAGNPRCNASVTNNFTTNAGNNAVGCYYFNPFSNSFPVSQTMFGQAPGQANPLYNASVANNLELTKWIWDQYKTEGTSRLFVVDAVLNGELPIEFSGGKIGWAAGGQFRRNFFRSNYNDPFNAAVTPCADTIINGTKNCLAPVGPFSLQAAAFPSNVVQNVFAVFAEANLPFTDTFSAHVAARYENYGEEAGGDTFNPKLDLRWQATDWLAFRGSVGTTFRAPPLTLLDPSPIVTQVSLNNAFRPVFTLGNADLAPEKATTYGVGVIVEAGPFKGTVDYWNFDLQDPFVSEPPGTLFNLMFPNNSTANCGTAAFADIQSRFTFDPNVCSPNNVSRLTVSYVNAGGIKTDGVDVTGDFEFQDVFGGELRFGAQASYIIKYQVAEQRVRGTLISPAFEASGFFNYGTQVFPLPEWKGVGYAEWEYGPHNIRVQTNYTDGYTDQ
ncbi:MAG: TonB-dependent receptor, partial [Phenylobacterium sp.]|uniref:TonB-dependent receptor domain-containing protein n=1 Tax=Phenylobacterium sp. TaxID=1871053 RepID=UPI0027361392